MLRYRHSRQGFTLVEILLVGALIALFAGIAIFNIKGMYDQNVRKAVMAEVKHLGTACAIAQNDLSIIPKFNYLMSPASLIVTGNKTLRADFDYMGFLSPVFAGADPELHSWPAPTSIAELYSARGYYSFSQTRGGLNQGRGGLIKVALPTGVIGDPPGQDSPSDAIVDWPADPWGNPYVLYMVKIDPEANPEDYPNWQFVEAHSEQPDFKLAVVSYGPNGVPGAVVERRRGATVWGEPGGEQLTRMRTNEMALGRLFTDRIAGDAARYNMLRPEGYLDPANTGQPQRVGILKGPDPNIPQEMSKWNSSFPISGNGPNGRPLEVRGILDQGTDDIVFVF